MHWMEHYNTTNYRFIKTQMGYREFGFMRYAEALLEGLKSPEPLTHMFSLARDRRCTFLIEQEIDQKDLPENAYELKILQDIQTPPRALNRKTFRISFYRTTGSNIPPYSSAIQDVYEVATCDVDEFEWFKAHAGETECIGYVWVHLDRCENYPLAAYVAEAIIEPPSFKNIQKSTESQTFIHCKNTYDFEILGQKFLLTGSFFAQQEGNVWCCAHAALISCLNQWHGTNGHSMSIEKINSILGIDHISRFGRDGLEVSEIKEILEEGGIPATILDLNAPGATREQILHAAYSSVEVGLPAIICFSGHEGHAMAVVGHTFDPSLWNSKASVAYFQPNNLGYKSSFSWVDKLVVQDDNFGPYQTVLKSDLLESVFAVVYPCHPKLLSNIPPFLTEVLVAYYLNKQMLANGNAENLLYHLNKKGLFKDNYWLRKLADAVAHRTQVLRQTTISANTYYNQLSEFQVNIKNQNYAADDQLIIVEISIPELYQWNHRRLGEALIEKLHIQETLKDGTVQTKEAPFVKLIRLPGIIIFADKSSLELHEISSDSGRYHCQIVMNDHR